MIKKWLSIALLLPALVFADDFVVGKDYEQMSASPVKQDNNGKITVIEFFSYGCSWCYRIEPLLENWVKQHQDKIEFSRIPVIFNKDWDFYAKAYYTVDTLGLTAKFNPLLFAAIQKDKLTLNTNQAMIDFLTAKGLEKNLVRSAFENSTTIDLQLDASKTAMAHYHIIAVPAVVINHQYKTDLQMAKNMDRFFKIIDFLLTKTNGG